MTIHPGAGGTSPRLKEMLLRMPTVGRSARLQARIMDYQAGEEAGLKSATVMVTGDAPGLLAAEAGVHRLVRISPFDQAARRHTSFASLCVWPELPEDVDIVIDDKDLRIDTFRSSGAGDQHVNVTDSAIRITHLPTGLVVSCQKSARSTQQGPAMKVLKARLYDIKMKENRQLDQIARETRDRLRQPDPPAMCCTLPACQGSPDEESVSDVNRVLDGDIDQFIKTYLMKKSNGTLGVTPDES
jgi:peptide chain release factor 2